METADIVVIGGGCTGTSTALQLARRRAGKILLLERATLAAGGTGRSSALVRQHYTHPALVAIALRALRIFQHFSEEIGGTSDFRETSFLATVGPEDVAALHKNVAMQREIGVDTRVMSSDEIFELDPRINVEDIGAAAYEPESGYADPYSTTVSFAGAARDLGVEIRQNTRTTGLVAENGRITGVVTNQGAISAGTVVVAAGFHSRELLLPLGIDLPVTPVRHAITIFERPEDFGPSHCTIIDFVQRAYMRPEGANLTLVGSSDAYHRSDDTDPDADRSVDADTTVMFGERFMHRFSGIDDFNIRRGYTGVYDVTPDGQPMLGALPEIDGLYLAFGFSGHGFKLSPVIGQILAEAICDGESSVVDIGLFRASRFAENDLIESPYPYARPITGSA